VRSASGPMDWITSALASSWRPVCPAQAISTEIMCGITGSIPRASQHRLDTQQHPLTGGDSALRRFFAAYYREASSHCSRSGCEADVMRWRHRVHTAEFNTMVPNSAVFRQWIDNEGNDQRPRPDSASRSRSTKPTPSAAAASAEPSDGDNGCGRVGAIFSAC
jgi:hypothetical protein